jgi:hypothetical protein
MAWRTIERVRTVRIARGLELHLERETRRVRGGIQSRLAVHMHGKVRTRLQARRIAGSIEAFLFSEDP